MHEQPLSGPAPTLRAGAAPQRAAVGLMLLSGFAGLGYQIVWTQQSALWLGHEAAAVLAVVTAFFAGLGIGGLWLGPRVERSRVPLRWYVGCELLMAGWSLALAFGLGPVSAAMHALTGPQPEALWQWTVAFAGTFLVLLPATVAMGATLPAMERVLAALGERGRSPLAALYAANTLGATVGVLATAFWLIPAFGLTATASLCAFFNLACAVLAGAFGRAGPVPAAAPTPQPGGTGLAVLAASGLFGIGYEVLVVRVLSQVSENTVYTFAILLAVYLVGTALGAAAYQRGCTASSAAAGALRDRLLVFVALACGVGTGSLWAAPWLRDAVSEALGPGMGSALVAEAAVALAAFALPAVAMGALFSHLATQARDAGIGFGRALGVNTLGAAAASLVFGVLLLPAFGAKLALLSIVAGYLLLAWRRKLAWGGLAAAALVAALAPGLAHIDVPEGGRVIAYREGATAAVSVVEDASGVSRLRIDNRQQEGSSNSLLADARQALLPLLLHPAPQRALFLGLGTGMTAASAAEDPTLQVDVAELLPEVIEASAHFTRAFGGGAPNPRLHPIAVDARRFVRSAGPQYDVIVADNFHPARSGSGSLYTVEHFLAVRARLAGDGLFCQWLPLHQLDLGTLRSIVRSFLVAYPEGMAMLATNSLETPVIGLVGRADGGRFDLARVQARVARPTLPQRLGDYGLADEFAVLGSFVAGPRALARFSADADLNTDDRPVVAYSAPRITYAPDSTPGERLLAFLSEARVEPGEVEAASATAGLTDRLAAYRAARDRFIAAGQGVRPGPDVQAMLAQVREPLLAVLRTSPDFRPAYDPLLRMAVALGRSDPAGAQALLAELARVQPARAEAVVALQRLDAALR